MEGARVLIVDDDEVDRLAVRRALEAHALAVEVVEADGSAAARERLRARSFDCVVLDYMLPDGDGLALLREARASGHRLPFVILTGQGDERIAVELMKAGASDYLPKSEATADRLAQCLRGVLRVAAAERQAAAAEREAEAARRRLAFLAEAGTVLADALDPVVTLQRLARLAVPTLADWCFVDLVEDGQLRRVALAHHDAAEADVAADLLAVNGPVARRGAGVARVVTAGEPDLVSDASDPAALAVTRDLREAAALAKLAPRSWMTVPLVARGRTLGAVTFVATSAERVYGENDLAFADEVARRAALAVDNARLFAEAREASRQLRHQLDFTQAITNSLAEGVCAIAPDGRVAFVNPAAEVLLQIPAREGVGRDAHALLHERRPDGCAEASCRLRTPPVAGQVEQVDDDFARADGTTFAASWTLSPIVSETGPTGAVLAFHDVSARRRAEAELEASRRQVAMSEKLSALGTLVSGVAHEIRTPLTYISNNVFLIRHRLERAAAAAPDLRPALEDIREFSAAALEGVDRINALVQNLRPFANPEPAVRVHAGLHEVAAGAVALFRATQRGHVVVEVDLRPTPPIHLDKGQIQRVVLNLLINAAEAMPRGGTVRIATRAVPGGGEVEVEDHGLGLTPEVQARMFDPFFTTKADGMGLGLAITRRIVEAHGGNIRYATEVGKGTRFVVYLPETRPEGGTATDMGLRAAIARRFDLGVG